jgi:hypothetical protein
LATSQQDKYFCDTESSHWNDIDVPTATGEMRPASCQNWRIPATLNNDGLQL